ncbi:hypothetical protein ACIQOV_02795 [Kitasatospora sp. NPDC091257]|uniref:hypothetical protein n=1 Tax=unclassified Kitasatospora TaxID=2633591 RepID=UPI002F90D334
MEINHHTPVITNRGGPVLDVIGMGSDKAFYHKEFNLDRWLPSQTGWDLLGGNFTSRPAVASSYPESLDIVGVAPDGAMHHKEKLPHGSGWFPPDISWDLIGGGFTSGPAVTYLPSGRFAVFGRGRDGAMYHKAKFNGIWEPSQTGWDALGGRFISTPAVCSRSDDWPFDIIALGLDAAIYYKLGGDPNGPFEPPGLIWDFLDGDFAHDTAAGGGLALPPTITAKGFDSFSIVGIGSDRAMYHKGRVARTWYPSQTDWDPLGGNFTSPPAITSWGDPRLDIVGLGNDGAMYHKSWQTDRWYPSQDGWEPLGGSFSSQPAITTWGPGRLDIVCIGPDHAMYHKAWDEGVGWQPSQIGWDFLGGIFS